MSGLRAELAMLANDNPGEGSGSPEVVRRLGFREAGRVALTRARNDLALAQKDNGDSEFARGRDEGSLEAWHIINNLVLELSGGGGDAPSRA